MSTDQSTADSVRGKEDRPIFADHLPMVPKKMGTVPHSVFPRPAAPRRLMADHSHGN